MWHSRSMFILMCLLVFRAEAGNYRETFDTAWVHAGQMIKESQIHLNNYFPLAGDLLLASAIVFPELIRYSALRDKVETTALKTLYVQYGQQFANFSVGYFQMKPSFAEEVEKAWMNYFPETSIVFDTLQSSDSRLKRVERLSNQRDQVIYLYCFYTLMQDRLKDYPNMDVEYKVCIMATAYNRGFKLSIRELDRFSHDLSFHTAIWPTSETPRYNYASIALEYFQQQNKTSNNQP